MKSFLPPYLLFFVKGFLLLTIAACHRFEYDPNQVLNKNSEQRLNYQNIAQLLFNNASDSTITLAVLGDTHTYYSDTEDAIKAINRHEDVDFVIHTGDISDHGYLWEFDKGTDILQKLRAPFIVTLGNHDVLANGEEVYRHMYGESNFSFIYKGVKFIFFNSNGREYNFPNNIPDIGWLTNEILSEQNSKHFVLVSHVPFFNTDFDQALLSRYLQFINTEYPDKKILVSISGHQHGEYCLEPNGTSLLHIGPGSTSNRNYYILRFKNEVLKYEKYSF
jgi:Icc protein